MRSELFDLPPQILNRIEVGGIRGQLHDGQAVGMRCEKLPHSFAGMIACAILNDKEMLRGLRQDVAQEGGIAVRVEPPCLRLGEEASREIVDEAKDLVRFAYATGRHFGLVSRGSPCIAQGAPLRKAGLIAKEQQGLPTAGALQHGRPRMLAPF
jgi:hypothetical protein